MRETYSWRPQLLLLNSTHNPHNAFHPSTGIADATIMESRVHLVICQFVFYFIETCQQMRKLWCCNALALRTLDRLYNLLMPTCATLPMLLDPRMGGFFVPTATLYNFNRCFSECLCNSLQFLLGKTITTLWYFFTAMLQDNPNQGRLSMAPNFRLALVARELTSVWWPPSLEPRQPWLQRYFKLYYVNT